MAAAWVTPDYPFARHPEAHSPETFAEAPRLGPEDHAGWPARGARGQDHVLVEHGCRVDDGAEGDEG